MPVDVEEMAAVQITANRRRGNYWAVTRSRILMAAHTPSIFNIIDIIEKPSINIKTILMFSTFLKYIQYNQYGVYGQ